MRIALKIAYIGTEYHGYQIQPNVPTIEKELFRTLEELKIITDPKSARYTGSGWTDAGVHALGMVANFKTSSSMAAESFQKALNSMLPRDVRIMEVYEADPGFHARYDSTGKTYRYDFFTGSTQPPAERLYRTYVPCPFKSSKVTGCLKDLIGNHDFSSFEAIGSRDLTRTGGRGAVRTLLKAACIADPARPKHFSFYFTGDGFLRHMVRNMAGTLFLVGSGRIERKKFATILAGKDRSLAGPTAPACGLFLEQVHYNVLSVSAFTM